MSQTPCQPNPASSAELTEAEVDALFAHMQELVDQLPQMEELSTRYKRANVADHIARFKRSLDMWQGMIDESDARIAAGKAALAEAQAAGDEERADQLRRQILADGQTRGLRVGPLQNAQAKIDEALAVGTFASLEEAAAAAIPDAERAQLGERLAAFRQDYAATLAACQKAEGIEDLGLDDPAASVASV